LISLDDAGVRPRPGDHTNLPHGSALADARASTKQPVRVSQRLLVLSYEFPPIGGGGSRVVAGLSKQLAAEGWSIDLVTAGFSGLAPEEEVDGVRVSRVPCVRRREHYCSAPEAGTYALAALPAVRRLAQARRPDFIHAHFIFPDGLIAWHTARQLGIPYVITAHGSDVPGYNPHRLKMAHRLLAPIWKRIVERAAVVVCPSEHLNRLIAATGASARTIVIPNGFEIDKFAPGPKDKRILVVTRMLERKGVQYVLQALDGLPLDFEVDVVGDGPYLPTLKSMARSKQLPVRFWGWLDNESPELKALYESASIYALPSENENFPVTLLEAMAAGAAIITTESTGCEEVVGDAGLLVPPRDVAAIRAALSTLANDCECRRAYGARARARLEEHFSWTVVGRRYGSAYHKYVGA
jgi:glycosyltransferase involved in cell wall biosynthesis